jgi:hypothetical protein
LAVLLPAAPSGVRAAAAPQLVVHLSITGGYRYSGTLSSPAGGSGSFCFVAGDYLHPGAREYGVDYDLPGLMNAQAGDYSKDTFFITVFRYGRATRYVDSRNLSFQVVVKRHAYFDAGGMDSQFHMGVQLARNGLSGVFTVSHVRAMPNFSSQPINARGSWRCSSLRHSAG